MNEQNKIEEIFENLRKWRSLPKYRFEERIDIFLSVYLEEILKAQIEEIRNGRHEIVEIIPQFPIKKELNNQSDNTDYAVFVKDIKDKKIEVYLIELKTDKGSINDKQIKYYQKAQEKDTVKIMQEIKKEIKPNSNKREKYNNMLNLLEEKGISEETLKGKPKIIYIIPNVDVNIEKNLWKVIYFKDIIKAINEKEPIAIGLKKLMKDIIEEK